MKKVFSIALMVAGSMLLFVGGLMIFIYLQEVFSVLHASDRSLIYWHLPIFFLGLGAVIGGSTLFYLSKKQS